MADTVEIHLRLGKVQQLFNSFDPSPFHEKDLDADAEEYIVDSVDEHPLATPVTLVVELPAEEFASPEAKALADGIHNYFTYQCDVQRRRLRFHFRAGRIALLFALAFLIACMALRGLVETVTTGTIARFVDEGLLILGWVAMWRPLEILLYDWWPVRHRRRLFEKLRRLPVKVIGAR